MCKLNIALVIENFNTNKGGVEHRTFELAKGLLANGHDVHIYSSKCNFDASIGISMHRIPVYRFGKIVKPLIFAQACAHTIRDKQHDIVHTQTRIFKYDLVTLGIGCHRAYLDTMSARKVSPSLQDSFELYLERTMFYPGNYSHIIVNSNKCKEEINYYYDVPAEKITVIHNGVDSDKYSPYRLSVMRSQTRRDFGLTPDDTVIAYIGSGFIRKGLDTLIKAVGRMKHSSGVKVLIAGKGHADNYKRIASQYNINDRLIWLGQTADSASVCSASDIFALPTRYDPFANSTLEALASELPVVTTRSNGVSEIIEDGVSGYVIDADSVDSLADRLDLLVQDESLRVSIGKMGRKAIEPYTWDKTTNETIDVYHAIISGRS